MRVGGRSASNREALANSLGVTFTGGAARDMRRGDGLVVNALAAGGGEDGGVARIPH